MPFLMIAKLCLVMILWASCFPLITIGIQYAPHLTFAWIRALIAGLALIFLAILLRRSFPKKLSVWCMMSVVGLGATTLGFLGMFHAAEFVSPGIATVVANTQPLLAAVSAGLILNEKVTASARAGFALGFVGIVIIAAPQLLWNDQQNFLIGYAYIALAVLGITVSNLLIKTLAGQIDVFVAMGSQMIFGSIPLMIFAFATEQPSIISWSPTFIVTLLVLSLPGTAIAYWLWFSVLENVSLNKANAFSFLVPIFGLSLGTIFYNEQLGILHMVGAVFVISGLVLVNYQSSDPASSN